VTEVRYLDVCSGYSAFTLASAGLGFRCAGYSEIEPFPRAMLQQRHQAVAVDWDHRFAEGSNVTPLFGDFTRIEEHHVGPIDLLTGGTPCQAFSVAGKRLGLDDPRGNLTLEFLALARRVRARWLLWENVPGFLSHDGGRTAGTFFGLLGECGYGWAYRVLDAQYVRVDGHERAVPQRRRRVFVVACLGDEAGPAAVLFEPESLRGDPAPRRETGEGIAGFARSSAPCGCPKDDGSRVIATLDASYGRLQGCSGQDANHGHSHLVAHALRADGFDASEDGTGRGTPIVPVDLRNADSGGCVAGTLGTEHSVSNGQAVAFAQNSRSEVRIFGDDGQTVGALAADVGAQQQCYIADAWAVRRLTPTECERLMGVPDGFTAIAWRGKPAADGPRYKVLGNSQSINQMRWIARGLADVIAARRQAGME